MGILLWFLQGCGDYKATDSASGLHSIYDVIEQEEQLFEQVRVEQIRVGEQVQTTQSVKQRLDDKMVGTWILLGVRSHEAALKQEHTALNLNLTSLLSFSEHDLLQKTHLQKSSKKKFAHIVSIEQSSSANNTYDMNFCHLKDSHQVIPEYPLSYTIQADLENRLISISDFQYSLSDQMVQLKGSLKHDAVVFDTVSEKDRTEFSSFSQLKEHLRLYLPALEKRFTMLQAHITQLPFFKDTMVYLSGIDEQTDELGEVQEGGVLIENPEALQKTVFNKISFPSIKNEIEFSMLEEINWMLEDTANDQLYLSEMAVMSDVTDVQVAYHNSRKAYLEDFNQNTNIEGLDLIVSQLQERVNAQVWVEHVAAQTVQLIKLSSEVVSDLGTAVFRDLQFDVSCLVMEEKGEDQAFEVFDSYSNLKYLVADETGQQYMQFIENADDADGFFTKLIVSNFDLANDQDAVDSSNIFSNKAKSLSVERFALLADRHLIDFWTIGENQALHQGSVILNWKAVL